MSSHNTITVSKDGPYIVSGSVSLRLETIGVNAAGESTDWVEGNAFPASAQYALCRCGNSNKKPFCDGTHAKIGFDGTETASRKPVMEQAQVLEGPSLQLADAEVLCAFARFCDPNGQVWNEVKDTDDPKVRVQFLQQVGNCPSGRLIAVDKHDGKSIEPKLPHSIGLVEDPAQKCSGPLWVRGGIALVGADGQAYEIRNRMTLCRCGKSENKPFCNGAHAADPKFRDGLVEPRAFSQGGSAAEKNSQMPEGRGLSSYFLEDHMTQNNLELMRTLDDSWNAQDWDTFEKRHSKDTTVFWPGQAEPTRGRDNHKAESIQFFKTFPDNHLINHPYKVEIAQGEWTCTVADFRGTMTGPMTMPGGTVIEPTNKSFHVDFCTVARWNEQGQIVEENLFYDLMGMLRQIGLMPSQKQRAA